MYQEQILNHLSSSTILTDAELHILFANPAAEDFLRISAKRLTAYQFPQIFKRSSLDLSHFEQCIRDRQSFTDSEVNLVTFDDNHSTAEISVTPIVQLDEQKQQQIQLLIEIKLLDQYQKISQESFVQSQLHASRDLIRGLAHEIKNPLGGIRGAAQILEKMLADEDLKECTQVIIEQSDRLRNLVDRLLGPNKLTQHKQTNIHKIIEQVKQLLEMEAEQGMHFDRDYDPSIPDFEVDPEQIQQVFLNIARNAMQALDNSGQIKFVTRVAPHTIIRGKQHKLVVVTKIIDNGPGIAEEIKDTLFYPMVTNKADGSGLGLSIAQTLVQQHEGKIEVESWPGHTEFSIYLPIIEHPRQAV
ncbi:nitrogen regulation protein NR(II) [Catenovulum sp. SM1970]|uniref:nitrogen regulation protein NR(II) n=1 Tax=Marinifaba aquimaris TaxID=2741323 RepID=UPI001572ACEF|nr:nitrogen regulation protein NR(II) [Marinifaba aquimaris]